ncbi:ABC transporter permease [Lacisediminihabitans changchengi]|uniref:Transport permease protein n=1 Tax=Lacisediminihabitans changchengi TaxID=2787634 RepID=A0A934VXL4_9MICO|nr:ABC transporter permease [Lacisediminihabitans changchengi]MBK4347057.1 ABC transporter permease [Lacisediminihabitans changchengi]MBK4347820.1 ABC transporter permease [Lacisediminihabitans changchengi]
MTTISSLSRTPSVRSHVAADSVTMLRRNLLHMVRYPALSMFTVLGPVVILLLFVFVFGGALGAAVPGLSTAAGAAASDRGAYLAYVVPGILVITIAGGAGGTATTVAMDMREGVVARFRTMSISRAAVLTGHVLGNLLQGLIAVALVFGVSLLIGFRPTSGPLQWLALFGVVALVQFAVVWLAVAMGMAATSVESASNLPLILVILPLVGSGFVPTSTMPAALQAFAQYQPFTPFTETIRGLLLATPIGTAGWLTLAWSLAIALAGYVWALALYNRRSVR